MQNLRKRLLALLWERTQMKKERKDYLFLHRWNISKRVKRKKQPLTREQEVAAKKMRSIDNRIWYAIREIKKLKGER